jgi:RING finger protein 113A
LPQLHDRGDYLQGWQLDNIYLSNRPTANAADPPPEAEEDLLPFACLICRQPFTDPIVTKCGHYFDSHCAIARYAKTPKCFACGTPTGGLFNKADKIFKKREKAMEMRQRADAAEEDMINGGGADAIEGLAEEAPPEPVGDFQQEGSEEESGSEREFEEDE